MSRQSSSRVPDVDPKSPAGMALTSAVQDKLRAYLGADYVDRSLAQYIVIMLAHKTGQQGVGDNLVEFLGEVDAREVASWLFENLQRLAEPPPPEPAQPAAHARQEQQRGANRLGGGAAAHAEQHVDGEGGEGEGLELDMAASDGGGQRSGSGGSDADTADAHGGGGGGDLVGDEGGSRRLASAVVRDDYRRRDERRGRSRSPARHRYSPPPRRRHSVSPGGRRASPHRRRSPPRGGAYAWEGGSGARYHGHDPYPYRGGWRADRSPPRRRSASPYGGCGHGHGPRHGHAPADWHERERQRRGSAHREDGWRRGRSPPPDRGHGRAAAPREHGRGGLRSVAHFEHDVRWEEEEAGAAAAAHRLDSSAAGLGLAPGLPVPGGGGGGGGRQPHEAAAAESHLAGRTGAAASSQQQLPPWERPSYMDLEQQRQQQAAQRQAAQRQQAAQQPEASPAGLPAASAATFGRALAQAAAAGLGAPPRSVSAAAHPSASPLNGSFQVTIRQGAGAAAVLHSGGGLAAPLLRQPGLQGVLQERLRSMELQLARLRAEQAEARLAAAQARRELSTAARLDMTVRSVCIRGVHPAASDRVLIAHFGACGFIQRISHLRDPISGKRSGVAFMQFAAASQAQAALALDGSSLLQRSIRVVPSDSPAARVAAARVLRAAHPPPVPVPLPMLAAPIVPLGGGRGRGRGASGRGLGGRGRASFKYVRPADQPGLGLQAGAAAAAGNASGPHGVGGPAAGGGDHAMAD